MRFELYIEKKRLDVNEGFSSLLTFAIDDIKDFAARNTTFSKTTILPGTANNNYLLGNIFDVKISNPYNPAGDNVATNFNPAVSADCVIFQDNIQVFKGTLRLLEVVIDNGVPEYEVAVFGELGGLVGALGSNKLEDLDFSDYDELWDKTNIINSWDITPGAGVVYPLIDYGTVSAAKVNYDFKAFRPALFVKEYIDKIFEAAGFTYESNIITSTRFKNLIIPNNEKQLYNRQQRILELATNSFSFTQAEGTTKRVAFSAIIAGAFTASDSNRIYTYTGSTVQGKVNCSLIVNFTNTTGIPFVVTLKKNGTGFTSSSFYGVSSPYQLDIVDYAIDINNGDYFEMEVTGPPSGTWSISFSTGPSRFWIDTQYATTVPLNYNETINLNGSTPRNVLQKDFLSSIVKLFNLYIYEDKFTSKKVLIEPYVDFFDLNPSGVVDWTYKLDRSKPQRVKPLSELNSRYYNFDYREDNDYYNEFYRKTYNENYGRRLYDSEFEFANDSTDIKLIFSPSPLVGYTGVDKIVTPMYKKNAGVEETFATNIRILQFKKITGVTSWDLMNSTTVLQSGLTSYGYAGHYDDPDAPANDIHFGVPAELYFTLATGAVNVTQFNVYWSPYMAEITDKDSKLLTAYFKLNAKDIFDLDFSKLIYVDGSYWRLNKIEDWNASEPDVCKCELLKVINLLY